MGCPIDTTTGPHRRRPRLHCVSLPSAELHQQNQRSVQGFRVCHSQYNPTRSTPSRSGDSINGIRAVLGCRSCLGKGKFNFKSNQKRQHEFFPKP
jgi:hypothetical protein